MRSLLQLKDGKNKLDWGEPLLFHSQIQIRNTSTVIGHCALVHDTFTFLWHEFLLQHQVSLSDNDHANLQALLEAIINKLKYDESYNFSEPVVIIVLVVSSLDNAPDIFPRVKMKLHSLSIESSSKYYWTTSQSWCEFLIVSCSFTDDCNAF